MCTDRPAELRCWSVHLIVLVACVVKRCQKTDFWWSEMLSCFASPCLPHGVLAAECVTIIYFSTSRSVFLVAGGLVVRGFFDVMNRQFTWTFAYLVQNALALTTVKITCLHTLKQNTQTVSCISNAASSVKKVRIGTVPWFFNQKQIYANVNSYFCLFPSLSVWTVGRCLLTFIGWRGIGYLSTVNYVTTVRSVQGPIIVWIILKCI